jgi:hypothetical protein
MSFSAQFTRFKQSKKLITSGPDLFYVFPDKFTNGLPTSLSDAFDQGFLVITCTDKPGQYYLNIANEEYTGDFEGLALILFHWAIGEGYQWGPTAPMTRGPVLPGEPAPIRYRHTASGHRVAWDEPGENF